VAHSWRGRPLPLAILLAAGLASFAPESGALALGDIQVRSALGEALDVRIPVTMERGESIEPSCFTLAREPVAEIPRLSAARISIERSAQGAMLRIRSSGPVDEPAAVLGVVAACPGQAGELKRDYSILLDPRPVAAPRPSAAPLSIAATLIARIGDTLESIANAIFPHNRGVKKSYIEALRASNPPLASLADTDPIPLDTPIALPDLRTFARAHPPAETQVASAPPRREVRRPAAPPRVAAAPREKPIAPPVIEARVPIERPSPVILPAHRTGRGKSTPGYQLKLSSGEVDLTRSRAIDDRMRTQLRDRQLILDADDQVAAVLALRNSVKQLETRVAELQLKLAGMPSSFPPAKAEPVAPAPRVVEPPKPVAVEPPKPVLVEPPKPVLVEPPKPVAVEPPKPAPVEPPKVAVVEPEVKPPPAVASPRAAPGAAPKAAATPGEFESAIREYWLWGLLGVIALVLAILAWRLARRRAETAYEGEEEVGEEPIVVAEEFERQEPVLAEESVAEELERRSMESDASLPTRLPIEGADDLRRRYIEERFPEILNRTIVLDDPDSVIKGARLFYEDGALARAIELLHFAIERRPEEVKTWLALFEIFRLERLSGQFADLAFRFKEQHGKSDYWRKVQFFGREIDPGNTLYQDESFKSFETIGPSEARKIAQESTFDPVAENWLNAPMDFQNEVLANELRMALMAKAGISDQDLVPNPMPALRNVEMFTVA
jgi:pilus assembly protein FimV